MLLQTTLCLAAAAAIINIWISLRCSQIRATGKVMHGDGGVPLLARRMRAHVNFIENTPLVLILLALIEMSGKAGAWLALVGAIFMLGRVCHAIGMDKETASPLRIFGAITALLTQIGLGTVCVLIALSLF